MEPYKLIITGTTGMVGEGVLLECLRHPEIAEILSVSRKPTGLSHDKLKEYVISDFLTLKEDDPRVQGYNACFFCAGVSSVGMSETTYTRITYQTTIHFAKVLASLNPQMTFIYVSGAGTDSSEKGRSMWARVKGKTENDLLKLPFKKTYNFRPAFMKPVVGQQHILSMYKYIGWLFPFINWAFPNAACTLTQVAKAMITCTATTIEKPVITVSDIKRLASR